MSHTYNHPSSPLYFLEGGGEMGELIRQKDWNNTDLGTPEKWPQTLKTFVAMILDNPFGMYIAWGKNYTQIYNDGYRPILGITKHPDALGISTKETFKEIWEIIEPMLDGVMEGKAVGFPGLILPLNRNGYVEECFFDFSYSPIRLEDGSVGGVLVTVIETTDKIKAENNLRESEGKFRALADNIPNLAWMANPDGYIYWYNKQWYEYTGTTSEEMEGWGWQKVHDPKELPKVMERWQASIATGKPFDMTFPLKGADGKFKQFLTRVEPVFNTEGKLYQWFGTNTDITDQILSEQRLKESEQRFRTMAEDADILIAISDDTSNATYFNMAWQKLTGRTVEELLSYGWVDLIHEKDRKEVLETYLHAFEMKQPWVGEFRVLSKDGTYRWLIAKSTVRRRPDNSFAGYISSSTDITEQKRAEDKLRNIIIHAPVGMGVYTGKDYIIDIVNPSFIEIAGKKEIDLIGKPLFEAIPEAKGQGLEEILANVFNTNTRFITYERLVVLPDQEGIMRDLFLNFIYEPYSNVAGNVEGIIIVVIDVTEQVIARRKVGDLEERNRLAIEIANIGTYDIDIKTDAIVTSERFDEIFGVKSKATREKYVSLYHPEDRPIRDNAYQTIAENGHTSYQVRLLLDDGTVKWVKCEAKIYRDQSNNPIRMIGTVLDVTESVLLQQQKDDFLSIASHELKTPLTSVKGYTHLLEDLIKKGDQVISLNIIKKTKRQVDKMTKMIHTFLDVNRIESSQLYLSKEDFDLNDLIRETINFYSVPEFKNRLRFSAGKLSRIIADREKIGHVIDNLVSNAFKYSYSEEEILLKTYVMEKSVIFEIKDSGKGINTDSQGKIFQRFYRSDNAKQNAASGFGIGLYFSSEVIKMHKGKIWFESEEGKGSTFYFSLPIL